MPNDVGTYPIFIIKITKEAVGQPGRTWSNSYEAGQLNDNVSRLPQMKAMALALMQFEQSFHANIVHFLRGTISTWVADTRPYEADEFAVVEFDNYGARDADVATLLGRDECLLVKRQVSQGHSGKISYRGCLYEGDVVGNSGLGKQLVPGNTPTTWFMNNGLPLITGYFGQPDAAAPLKLALIHDPTDNTATVVRWVEDFKVRGIHNNKSDHAYYNRTPVPAGP